MATILAKEGLGEREGEGQGHHWNLRKVRRGDSGAAEMMAFECQATVDDPAGEWQEAAHMIPEDDKEPAAAVEEDLSDAGGAAEMDPYAELEADVLKWKELAVRTAADLDNFRKRSAREREEAIRYANQGLLEELLPVIDNFEMGMLAASQDKSSMIYIGMDMVRRQLNDFLSNLGVTEIPAEGKTFDPNVHEAISQEDCAADLDGKVLRVNRRGFMLRDRLLRPAVVVVGKTGGEEG